MEFAGLALLIFLVISLFMLPLFASLVAFGKETRRLEDQTRELSRAEIERSVRKLEELARQANEESQGS